MRHHRMGRHLSPPNPCPHPHRSSRRRDGPSPMLTAMAVACVAAVAASSSAPVLPTAAASSPAAGVAAEPDDAVKAFFVTRSEASAHAVTVGGATCTFSFDTTTIPDDTAADDAAPDAAAAAGDATKEHPPETLLGNLEGTCVNYSDDFWEYTVCIGRKVEQHHRNERFTLGTWVATEGTVQHFHHGSACAARNNDPRTAEVRYGCADAPTLFSVEEVATCSYAIVVGAPELCGHSKFPDLRDSGGRAAAVSAAAAGAQEAGGGARDREPWVVEVEQLGDGSVLCSAFSTDDVKKGASGAIVSDLRFVRWSLEVVQHPGLGSTGAVYRPVDYAARRVNRVPVPPAHMSVHKPAGPTVPASISGGGVHSDGLEYVSLTAQPVSA